MTIDAYTNHQTSRTRRRSALKWLLGIAVVVTPVVLFVLPHWFPVRGGPEPDYIRTATQMRQIGLMLAEFQNEFGRMPHDSTIALVHARNPGSKIPLGTSSSDDYFHQLFVAELSLPPEVFYGSGVSTRRPGRLNEDLPIDPGSCGIAYIVRDDDVTRHDTPVLLYPLARGRLVVDDGRQRKAIVMFADQSVRSLPVDPEGRIKVDNRDLFDPAQPHWNGKPFRVAWPK